MLKVLVVFIWYLLSGCANVAPPVGKDSFLSLYKKIYDQEEQFESNSLPDWEYLEKHGATNVYSMFQYRIFGNGGTESLARQAELALERATENVPAGNRRRQVCRDITLEAMRKIGAIDSVVDLIVNGQGHLFERNEWVAIVKDSKVNTSALYKWRNKGLSEEQEKASKRKRGASSKIVPGPSSRNVERYIAPDFGNRSNCQRTSICGPVESEKDVSLAASALSATRRLRRHIDGNGRRHGMGGKFSEAT